MSYTCLLNFDSILLKTKKLERGVEPLRRVTRYTDKRTTESVSGNQEFKHNSWGPGDLNAS